MGRVEIRIPLVTWRDGRPRFIPGPSMTSLGYKGEDLRHGIDGAWFSLDEAIAWSKARQAEIADRRAAIAAGASTVKKTKAAVAKAREDGLVSVSQVVSHFLDHNPAMLGVDQVVGKRRRRALAANTVRFYKTSARVVETFDGGAVWDAPAVQLTGRALDGILHRIEEERGLAQTRAVRALLSAAFKWGRQKRLVSHNPVAALEDKLPVLEPRVRPGTILELETFIRGCDALGWPDMADSIALGAWTAQRQNDRLALSFEAISADGILFAPHKKNNRETERLLLPVSAAVAVRLEGIRERRRSWRLNSPVVLLCERLQRPWEADWYRKVFRVLRHAVAFGALESNTKTGKVTNEARAVLGSIDIRAALAAAGVAPLASLGTLRDQDLRDTCLSWLPMAGATKYEIAGFSGHAFGKDDAVLKHYLAIPPEFARAGMVKLEAWYQMRLAELEAGKEAKEAARGQ